MRLCKSLSCAGPRELSQGLWRDVIIIESAKSLLLCERGPIDGEGTRYDNGARSDSLLRFRGSSAVTLKQRTREDNWRTRTR